MLKPATPSADRQLQRAAQGLPAAQDVDKSDHRIGSNLRALRDADGDLFFFTKDCFELGLFSQVFAGCDRRGKPVVLKQLSLLDPKDGASCRETPRSQPEHVAAEVQIMRAARSPVGPVAFLQTRRDGVPSKQYIVMRPMSSDLLGCSRELAKMPRRLRESVTLYVLRELAEQLARMHESGIVHRDVKTENVFVLGAKIFLADFGSARMEAIEARYTVSVPFCAPEVFTGSQPSEGTPARDIWALGIIGLALFVDDNPFDPRAEARDCAQVRERLVTYAESPHPEALLPLELAETPGLGNLLISLLHPNPAQRPSAAGVLACIKESHVLTPPRRAEAVTFLRRQRHMVDAISLRLRDLSRWVKLRQR